MPNQHGALSVEMIVTGPFAENCYLLREEASGRGIVVDPGDEADRILSEINSFDLTAEKIVNTHAHIDHVGAVAALKRALSIPFWLHPAEGPILAGLNWSAQMFGLPEKEEPTVDSPLADGQRIAVGDLMAEVIETPGHSPGGCCLHFADQGIIVVGDTLFRQSIGRTDLPGGDMPTLLQSIRQRLFTLPDETVVYPGHGPATTIGEEKATNPFVRSL